VAKHDGGIFMYVPWILIGILVLLILGVMLFILAKQKKKTPTDYYALFMMGIIWFVIGLPTGIFALWGLGLVFMTAGLVNKNKWKKNRTSWKKMSKGQRKLMIALIIAGFIAFIAGIICYILLARRLI